MNPRAVLSVILLLVATSVLSTGFTATAAASAAAPGIAQSDWETNSTQIYQQQTICHNPKISNDPCPRISNDPNYQVLTSKLPTSQPPNYYNCQNYPNNQNYPNCQNYQNYPNNQNYQNYPNNQNYGYYPSYGYEDPTTTQTVTATSYSTVTETSELTSTTTSIPAPVSVTTSATVTTTTTTSDTTAETLYSTLMAVFLALFLATLVLLVGSRYRGSKGSNPQSSQAASARPAPAHIATSYRCSACGTDVDLGSKFCGSCGAQLKSK